MSTKELTTEAMALPLDDQISLAQALWESINASLPEEAQDAAVRDAIRRDDELSSGKVTGRSHDEVMQTARRAIECP